jgi:predicted 3-demethylubiquinone-9 3-methyltransferase (glyoxalase superfamily)
MRQKITPCIWFDSEAEEAARFYAPLFRDSRIGKIARYDKAAAEAAGQSEGDVLTVDFQLGGQSFVGLNGGPAFEPNPSISFHVKCSTKDQVDKLWDALSDDGEILIPLDAYPFNERYGWCADRYGVSWQLIFAGAEGGQILTPVLMFVGDVCGRAEEAVNFYASLFEHAQADVFARYGPDEEPDTEGSVQYAVLTVNGREVGAMDSGYQHDFAFNEAISFIVNCEDQQEIDHFWSSLAGEGGQESMCGWLKDRFGLSWQIVPNRLIELITTQKSASAHRAMEAMLQMKKLDIAKLEAALEN